jgi:hypothetical protein
MTPVVITTEFIKTKDISDGKFRADLKKLTRLNLITPCFPIGRQSARYQFKLPLPPQAEVVTTSEVKYLMHYKKSSANVEEEEEEEEEEESETPKDKEDKSKKRKVKTKLKTQKKSKSD